MRSTRVYNLELERKINWKKIWKFDEEQKKKMKSNDEDQCRASRISRIIVVWKACIEVVYSHNSWWSVVHADFQSHTQPLRHHLTFSVCKILFVVGCVRSSNLELFQIRLKQDAKEAYCTTIWFLQFVLLLVRGVRLDGARYPPNTSEHELVLKRDLSPCDYLVFFIL